MTRRVKTTTAALAALLLALAGCASGPAAARRSSTANTAAGTQSSGSAHPSPTTAAAGTGTAARALAARIPGCTPQPRTATAAARLGLPDTARLFTGARDAVSCTLRGRGVVLLTYRSPAAQSAAAAVARASSAYYATGAGWLALPIDRSEPVGQQSVVQDVALALNGQILPGANPTGPPSATP